MLTENTIFLAQPLHLSLSLSRGAQRTRRVTILLRTLFRRDWRAIPPLCRASIHVLLFSRVPLSLCPILGIARRLFVVAINRYVTRCQLRTAGISVTVINPACLPRSCVIVPVNRNSARVHVEQDNTRGGIARRNGM